MAKYLTNSSDETEVQSLFSSDLIYGIPYFQRAYKWNEKNISRFETDLENLIEYEGTSHFLGAIIVFGKQANPSDPNYYEVIDGQQRLTTCYLSFLALAKAFVMHGEIEEAKNIYLKYIALRKRSSTKTNAKLICCKEDRAAMNHVFDDLLSDNSLKYETQNGDFQYVRMPDTGNQLGRIWKNYCHLYRFFESQYQEQQKTDNKGIKRLGLLYDRLVNNFSVVQIVVKDPTDGPKIFDSLNSKQEPMTIGDLVRNEIFAKYTDQEESEIDVLDRDYWHPFYERFKQNNNNSFDKVFEQYFFPYVLTENHTVKKADAFNYLRDQWNSINDPKIIIDSLRKYQDIYVDLYYGTSLTQCSEGVRTYIHRLARMAIPTSVYPFIMRVVYASINGEITTENTQDILARVESFLVRRVVCGYEPTGLHAVFKSLWNDCEGDYSAENVENNIRRHYTVKWPDNDEFRKNVLERPLYKVRMTPYILAEWNGYLGGDIPNLNSQQIEHVLPETPSADSQWNKDWPKKKQEDLKHCLANLLPISGELNNSIKNADYDKKRDRYINDSALKAPREFGKTYSQWTPVEFDARAKKLADWAIDRWKY